MVAPHLKSLLVCFTSILLLNDDHIGIHREDIDALETHAAHVSIEPHEPSPVDPHQKPQHRIVRIFIPECWRGGDEALIHVERIIADAPDPKPVVYILGRPSISADRLEKLESTLPKGSFARRSPVQLGIVHSASKEVAVGVSVFDVASDSAAALAGIIPDDVITKIDETEIVDFNSLTASLALRKPGQSVTVRVVRNGESRRIVVKLKGWYDENDDDQRTKR